MKEYAKAAGQVLAQIVAFAVLATTGADVLFAPEVGSYIHLDPNLAQDKFFSLCGYYGIPLKVPLLHRCRPRDRQCATRELGPSRRHARQPKLHS